MKLLFKGPVTTASGYGVHARQILKGLLASNVFDISVKCLNWGNTSFLFDDSPFFNKVFELSDKYVQEQSQGFKDYDVSIQVTIPNEFEKLARIIESFGFESLRCAVYDRFPYKRNGQPNVHHDLGGSY